ANNQYVTADPAGVDVLSAARTAASTDEFLRWIPQPDGTYLLEAMANKAEVQTTSSGLVNNVNATNGKTASKFKLISASSTTTTPVPASGFLKSVSTGKYVWATTSNTTLLASEAASSTATTWYFDKLAASTNFTTLYDIRSGTTQQVVTDDPNGTTPLAAARSSASGWEQWQFAPSGCHWVISHTVSGLLVKVQPDGTLMAHGNTIDATTTWTIEGSGSTC
ncbi:hypothetical protein BZG36_05464, partial [Bifiguratus adelaidae]